MKQTRLIVISVLVFFVIVNSSYFWDGKPGLLTVPIFLLLFLIFFAVLIRQISKSITEKFSNKERLLVMVILTITGSQVNIE